MVKESHSEDLSMTANNHSLNVALGIQAYYIFTEAINQAVAPEHLPAFLLNVLTT